MNVGKCIKKRGFTLHRSSLEGLSAVFNFEVNVKSGRQSYVEKQRSERLQTLRIRLYLLLLFKRLTQLTLLEKKYIGKVGEICNELYNPLLLSSELCRNKDNK